MSRCLREEEEEEERGNSVTTKGLMISAQIWTFTRNTDAVVLCEEDRVVQAERSGI